MSEHVTVDGTQTLTNKSVTGYAKASLVQDFTTTASGQTVPAGVVGCFVTLVGVGGPGGSGRRGAAGTVRCGGGGGAVAGGCYV